MSQCCFFIILVENILEKRPFTPAFSTATFSPWALALSAGCAHPATPKIWLKRTTSPPASSRKSAPTWLITSDSSTMTTSAGSGRLENTIWFVFNTGANVIATVTRLNIHQKPDKGAQLEEAERLHLPHLGCRITSQDPLFRPERKSLHRFGYQPSCGEWKSFGKRNANSCAEWAFLQRVMLPLLPRLLWLLAETTMMSAALTVPSEKPLMCMMDPPSAQVC